MKNVIFTVMIVLLSASVSFAGEITTEGLELSPVEQRIIQKMVTSAGPEAEVFITVDEKRSEKLSNLFGNEMIYVDVIIFSGDKILEGYGGMGKINTFTLVRRCIEEALEKI